MNLELENYPGELRKLRSSYLRLLCETAQLSQRAMAAKIGYPERDFRHCCSGRNAPPAWVIVSAEGLAELNAARRGIAAQS